MTQFNTDVLVNSSFIPYNTRMLEIVNNLNFKKHTKLDNFMTYFGIYEDKVRAKAIKKLLLANRKNIKYKTCVEAGAGHGEISKLILNLDPKKLYCVEENALSAEYLSRRFKSDKRVKVLNKPIEKFKPAEKIDFLFHEFYGCMLMDESLSGLSRLKFKPVVLAPNEGYLLLETVKLKALKDPVINTDILPLLNDALITDLFLGYKFKNPKRILKWKYGENNKTLAVISVPKNSEVLVFGMEIWHDNKRICGTRDTHNWPYVFTPVKTRKFRLSFKYNKCFSDVNFRWV